MWYLYVWKIAYVQCFCIFFRIFLSNFLTVSVFSEEILLLFEKWNAKKFFSKIPEEKTWCTIFFSIVQIPQFVRLFYKNFHLSFTSVSENEAGRHATGIYVM